MVLVVVGKEVKVKAFEDLLCVWYILDVALPLPLSNN